MMLLRTRFLEAKDQSPRTATALGFDFTVNSLNSQQAGVILSSRIFRLQFLSPSLLPDILLFPGMPPGSMLFQREVYQ